VPITKKMAFEFCATLWFLLGLFFIGTTEKNFSDSSSLDLSFRSLFRDVWDGGFWTWVRSRQKTKMWAIQNGSFL
jgi:hypothetical protein